MGYAIYQVGKRWGGYGVTTTCEHPGCNKKIDRGMSSACGGEPFSEYGCDLYFCDKHRCNHIGANGSVENCDHEEECDCEFYPVCERCAKGDSPFDYKPEHPEWVYHLLNHYSWAEWRKNNPDTVAELVKLPSSMPEYWNNSKE